MVVVGTWGPRRFALSIKPSSVTVEIETLAEGLVVLSYDRAGRLWSALFDGVTYRRALDGRMLAKWRPATNSPRRRRWLAPPETWQVEQRAQERLSALLKALRRGKATLASPLNDEAWTLLEQAAAFGPERSREDAQRFAQVYRPIGILPPDQYLALVLQATEGCPFNTCTFCSFYRDRPFQVKTPEAFREHALAVRAFLGAGLSLRRGVFLGDANALVIPRPRLERLLQIAHEVFPEAPFKTFYAFLDGFSGRRKTPEDYAALNALGLHRVYIGMESGHAPLLRFLHKPGTPEDVLSTVQALKAGGVAVGVIVLLGAGGKRFAAAHVRDTVNLLNAMPLTRRDLLYFSDLVVTEDLEYARLAATPDLQPLDEAALRAQEMAIRQGLRFPPGQGPRVSRYDIREFVY